MKRKGFTLIELLAVIVILAIIAIIATPMILGVIEKARKGASEQSTLGYIDAVEKQVAINQVKNENLINDGTYNVPMNGITVKGEAPTKGWLKIEKGMVTNYSFVIGKYVVTKGSETVKGDEPAKSEEEVTKIYPVYSNGTAVYYNPETNEKCNESEAVSTTGTKTGCMKWYTFNDEGKNASTVNMILDHNTTAKVAYNSTKINTEPKEVATALTTDTTGWNSSLNARLITAEEIAKITGNISFIESALTSDKWFYFDSNNQTQTVKNKGESNYYWLFDYTSGCTRYGCHISDSSNNGYWTSTPVSGSSSNVWLVSKNGRLYYYNANDNTYRGVRPVITVSKDIISE